MDEGWCIDFFAVPIAAGVGYQNFGVHLARY